MNRNRLILSTLLVFVTLVSQGCPGTRPEQGDPPVYPTGLELTQEPLPRFAIARFGTTRLRHKAGFVAFTPDGNALITSGTGNTFLWDCSTGRALLRLPAGGSDEKVTVSGNGRMMAVSDLSNCVELWDLRSGRETMTIGDKRESENVHGVSLSSDGNLLATSHGYGWGKEDANLREPPVRLWDTRSGMRIGGLGDPNTAASDPVFAPKGRFLATIGGSVICLWDIDKGNVVRELLPPDPSMHGIAISPDGSRVACYGWARLNVDPVQGHTTVAFFEMNDGNWVDWYTPRELPSCIAFAPDGRLIVVGTMRGSVELWDPDRNTVLRTLEAHSGPVYCVAVSADGTRLASVGADCLVRIWSRHAGLALLDLPGHSLPVKRLSFSPDGNILLSEGEDGRALVWDVPSAGFMHRVGDRLRVPQFLAWVEGANSFLAYEHYSTLSLWDAGEGNRVLEVATLDDAILEPRAVLGARRLFMAKRDGSDMGIWDALSGERIHTLPSHGRVSAVAGSSNGTVFVSAGGTDGANQGDANIYLWDGNTGRCVGELPGHPNNVLSNLRALEISPDGNTLASSGWDKTCKLWDVSSIGLAGALSVGDREWFEALAFSPDGSILATGHPDSIRLWDVKRREVICQLTGAPCLVTSLAFSPNGRLLASGQEDSTILLWDVVSALRAVEEKHMVIPCPSRKGP
jgi:WD40 repeat protein